MDDNKSSSSKGKAPKRPPDDHDLDNGTSNRPSGRPNFMTVGTGSASRNALRLAALLDDDSGYGDSIIYEDSQSLPSEWAADHGQSALTPNHGNISLEGGSGDGERRTLASHVHQMMYNRNRTALSRTITRTVESLRKLQDMNAKSPAHYPFVERAETASSSSRSRPTPMIRNSTSILDSGSRFPASKPPPLQRAETVGGPSRAESSLTAERGQVTEPSPTVPQLTREFSILKLDLQMGPLSRTELVHTLGKSSISALLDEQIGKTIRYLFSLRERIEDSVSKVLVTGDLNAGKSTFCNALLRRKVLPEDQQPCTSIFCVVLDVRENAGIEEVHAVPNGQTYNRNDEQTFHVFKLNELEKIVIDNEHWSQCLIFIKEIRSVDKSLLNNGVVDIALIDAPGLNMDSVITTANYTRQEEIDVVVFVVSAANYFTQSAKEFVLHAAREKAYMFMVVNGFDNIKDQQRCKERILKQIQQLSPTTSKEASELVHFVSSHVIPVAPTDFIAGSSSGSGSGSGGGHSSGAGDPGDDDGDDKSDPGIKGENKEWMQNFEELEASLRRFVLEKRARSKLAPAKTYLMNLLGDIHNLAAVNRDVSQADFNRVSAELDQLEPELEKLKKLSLETVKETDRDIESAVAEVYSNTRDSLGMTINDIHNRNLNIDYPGLFGVYQYADDLKHAMLGIISETVDRCEGYARERTVVRVNAIKSLGILHLGNNFPDFHYRPENMFRKKRDAIARQVDIEVDFLDFFDFASLWQHQEKTASTSMAITVAGLVGGRLLGGARWVPEALEAAKIVGPNNLRRLIVPGMIATALLATAYAVASIPTSLPRRLSIKLATQLASLDYAHTNATRISAEVRRALKYPADNLHFGLQRSLETLLTTQAKTDKVREEAKVAQKYFGNLARESTEIWEDVRRVDLEGPLPSNVAMI